MRLIVLEGVNGAGKTSIGRAIEEAAREAGETCLFADPSAGGPGQELRRHMLSLEHPGDTDAIVFTALRCQRGAEIVREARDTDALVLLERWSLALAAYGAVDGADPGLVEALRGALSRIAPVDHTVLLDVPGPIAHERVLGLDEGNRFETIGSDYLERVAAAYRRFAQAEPATSIVDATRPVETTFRAVREALATGLTDPPGWLR